MGAGEPPVVALQLLDQALHARQGHLHLERAEGIDGRALGPVHPARPCPHDRDLMTAPAPRRRLPGASPELDARTPPQHGNSDRAATARVTGSSGEENPHVFLAAVFFAAVFVAVVFLAAVFVAVVFFAGAARPRFTGSRPRFSASSSAARSMVTVSTASPLRSVALVVPSVT